MTDTITEQTQAALKRFGKSVCLISAADDNGRYVTPSSAVTNLSNTPPTLLLPIEKTASLYPLLSAKSSFCVNVLGASHTEVVNASIKLKGEDRFSEGIWQTHTSGVPILSNAQAAFVCEFETSFEYETHGIIIGRVVDVQFIEEVDPLVYVGGGFKTLP